MRRDRTNEIFTSVIAIACVVVGDMLGMPWWTVACWIGGMLTYDLIMHDPHSH